MTQSVRLCCLTICLLSLLQRGCCFTDIIAIAKRPFTCWCYFKRDNAAVLRSSQSHRLIHMRHAALYECLLMTVLGSLASSRSHMWHAALYECLLMMVLGSLASSRSHMWHAALYECLLMMVLGSLASSRSQTYRGIRLSSSAQTHSLHKLQTPSRCVECDRYVYFQGAECEQVTLFIFICL